MNTVLEKYPFSLSFVHHLDPMKSTDFFTMNINFKRWNFHNLKAKNDEGKKVHAKLNNGQRFMAAEMTPKQSRFENQIGSSYALLAKTIAWKS